MTVQSTGAPLRTYTEADYEDFEHTGPDTLMGRWLRRFWHPVFLAKELPTNWPKPVRVMGEDFTLFRSSSGTIFMTEARCPHRRTQLHLGWVEGEKLTCRFHGWQFDARTGECIKQPLEERPFCATVRLKTYPVQEYLGLIFAYIGEGDAPPMERYPQLEGENIYLEATVNYHDFNYFNNRENDPLHTPFTHATLDGGAFEMRGVASKVTVRETGWGFLAEVVNQDGVRETLQYGMPCTNNVPAGGGIAADAELGVTTEHFGWKLPVDDQRGMHFLVFAAHVPAGAMAEYKARREQRAIEHEHKAAAKKRPSIKETAEAVLAGTLRLDDIGPDDVDPPDLGVILVQDWVVLAGQGVIHTQRAKERLGASDATVVLNRRLLRRELKALAEGKPLKQWRYDEQEAAVSFHSPTVTATSELKAIGRERKTK